MAPTITIERKYLGMFKTGKMPAALKRKLNDLLDKQDRTGKLTARERKEAEALAEMAESLTLLKLNALFPEKSANGA